MQVTCSVGEVPDQGVGGARWAAWGELCIACRADDAAVGLGSEQANVQCWWLIILRSLTRLVADSVFLSLCPHWGLNRRALWRTRCDDAGV
jgi:hypothetical protein